MNVTYKRPTDKLSEYVQDILVIENYHVTVPFCLPLFANGTPTLLFHTAQGQIKKNSGYLTLFGQTILPDKLQIKDACRGLIHSHAGTGTYVTVSILERPA